MEGSSSNIAASHHKSLQSIKTYSLCYYCLARNRSFIKHKNEKISIEFRDNRCSSITRSCMKNITKLNCCYCSCSSSDAFTHQHRMSNSGSNSSTTNINHHQSSSLLDSIGIIDERRANKRKFGERTIRKKRRKATICSSKNIVTPTNFKIYPNLSKIIYQYSLVLLLILSSSLEFNNKFIIGQSAQATEANINILNNSSNSNNYSTSNVHDNFNYNNSNSIHLLMKNDNESLSNHERYSRNTLTLTHDNVKNQTPIIDADSSDNYKSIPFEYNGEAQQTTTLNPTLTSITTTKRPISVNNLPKKPLLRLTEAELLPLSDFNVQQPAFTDLIRVWPPTTLSNAQSSSHDSKSSSKRYARQQQQQQSLQQKHIQHQYTNEPRLISESGDEEKLLRNHLNEDFDDTIITADQGFDLDQLPEPPTWINYLGDLGDYLYVQLRQPSVAPEEVKEDSSTDVETTTKSKSESNSMDNNEQLSIEEIDEILDDYYYDQYENSQVLYYGAQLVRVGDIVEIGCYLPKDQRADWTKSGRPLRLDQSSSARVVRRGDFLGAKQNFSLKIFEASLSDSGNYRCNKLSRKYHKLVVVPLKTSTAQLYMIQQRLLSVINPQLMSTTPPSTYGLPPISRFSSPTIGGSQVHISHSPTTLNQIRQFHSQSQKFRETSYILPGYLIVENQPLIVNCNITDEFILRKLRENPKYQLTWYKNGRQIASSPQSLAYQQSSSHSASTHNKQQPPTGGPQLGRRSGKPTSASTSKGELSASNSAFGTTRVQFLQANGRQLYITSALYSDAGEYLCSWSKLPLTRGPSIHGVANGEENGSGSDFFASDGAVTNGANDENNFIPTGNLVQLMVPVKLRPFKSTYHARKGNQLRLICHAQRGYPTSHIVWYIGNRIVDKEFLKQHPNEFRILQLNNQNQLIVTSSPTSSNNTHDENGDDGEKKLVEIYPIPSTRQQMHITGKGRGQWVEYRDLKNENFAIDNYEQQLRYMQTKLSQLNGQFRSSSSDPVTTSSTSNSHPELSQGLLRQSSVSVLVINSLNVEQHTSRFSCRATSRANTDEVTTVIRVQESNTIPTRPSSGRATVIPGQPLHFQCQVLGDSRAQFYWYKTTLDGGPEIVLEPGMDDNIEIQNDKITIHKANRDTVGDYTCRGLDSKNNINTKEWAVIKARMQPYIEDFGVDTSHTGKSSVLSEGDKLELTCSVPDHLADVNITWLRSSVPDDERTMVKLDDSPSHAFVPTPESASDPFQTFTVMDQNIMIQTIDGFKKKLIIPSIRHEHRGHYVCMADNGITERTRKVIFIRVKDKFVALWPFFAIVAELFILFTIIHIWETQRAYKEVASSPPVVASAIAGYSGVPASNKRLAVGPAPASESVPLTSG